MIDQEIITLIRMSLENYLYKINQVPSIDGHAILIHLTGEHSEQHQLQQTQRKQILLVDQTCRSKL